MQNNFDRFENIKKKYLYVELCIDSWENNTEIFRNGYENHVTSVPLLAL